MIDFHNVSVSFVGDKKALNNVSFKIDRGEFVYITGKSGAGKSTLLRLIYADLYPTSGIVLVGKKNVSYITKSSIPYLRRNIGVIFQDFKLLENYTVYENIKIALEIFYLDKTHMENKIIPLLHKLDIFKRRNTIVKKLSGGEKQRVAIARALINEPLIILADEPTGNLDPERAETTINLLQNIAKNGSTVLVATHDEHLINKFPARVLKLENGKLVSDTVK
ncbi:cell division ATP-binding protein FtsE [Deferribacter autotrophicus]|uniref:Cell division ATP-binding protein FtsE n=1 Tax=Deferribacter autotrophicus TaxID=500465 RepID=A0A5A8F0L4_9BACT|nr:cell division ATP-binding protein FtsE [Deferribacter autotrophicus]KAA0257408.1 cell division ATP-binding protein FtsE [Deferribacter autotrophicus]